MDECRHRPVDAAERAARRLLHHELDRLGKALVVALHLAQHPQLRSGRVQADLRVGELFFERVALVRARLEPKRVSGDHILRRRHIFLCRGKALFTRRSLIGDSFLPRQRRLAVGAQCLLALKNVRERCFHTDDLGAASCRLRGEEGVICTQRSQLFRRFTACIGQRLAFFRCGAELFIDLRKLAANLRNARLLLRDLAGDAAAPVFLIGQLLPHTRNIFCGVVDRRLHNGLSCLHLLALLFGGGNGIALFLEHKTLAVEFERKLLRGGIK